MKVLKLKVASAFDRINLLSIEFEWKCTAIQLRDRIFNRVNQLLRLTPKVPTPRKVMRKILMIVHRIYNCIVQFPQYMEDILTSLKFLPSSQLLTHFQNRYNCDVKKIFVKFGCISDTTIIQHLIRRDNLSGKQLKA